MSKIDYQVLREAAVAIETVATPQKLLAFRMKVTPQVVLALLDEREAQNKCIAELEKIATDYALKFQKAQDALKHVVLMRKSEQEAADNNLIDSECHVAELEEALRDKQALLEASEKRIAELRDWNAGLAQESLTYQQRVAELEVIKSAAEKLVRCKGRYHSEQNYRALAALFGVTVPDLPPLEAESVSQTYKLNELSGNSPVTPDGWISCSERIPAQDDWVLIYSKHGEYMAGQVQGEYVELSDGTLSWLGNVLFWMPLPEPPQEVN
ncbi:ead/Ea22-like family protein [Escherichia coli]|uniref:ead/Ea22-like family protein n=2 Tax=Escherichia coli TaxID=562 RepID=UPI003D7C32F9